MLDSETVDTFQNRLHKYNIEYNENICLKITLGRFNN